MTRGLPRSLLPGALLLAAAILAPLAANNYEVRLASLLAMDAALALSRNIIGAAALVGLDELVCREFQQTISVSGDTQQAHGSACRQPDGSWQIVQ